MAERMKEISYGICLRGLIKEIIEGDVKSVWTLPNAIYYCVCVFTTIGYGDIIPITIIGKVLTIVYAFFGIPFWLTLVARFGNQMNNYVKAGMYYSNRWFYGDIKRDEDAEKGVKGKASPHLYVAEFDRQVKLLTTAAGSRPVAYSAFYQHIREIDARQLEKSRASFHIPIKIPLLLMISYIITGALALTITEEWNYLDSIYFIFITLLTIGFGDVTVQNSVKLIFCGYVLVGMALFSFFFAVTFDSVENIMFKIKEALEHKMTAYWQQLQKICKTAFSVLKNETKTIIFHPRQLWERITQELIETTEELPEQEKYRWFKKA